MKGRLKEIVHQQMGGLRSSMGLTGSATVEDMRTKAEFVRILVRAWKNLTYTMFKSRKKHLTTV